MRRQVLQFPAGKQFKKIVEDDHEWMVITDTQLNILAARRGEKHRVTAVIIDEVYREVRKMVPEGKVLKVLDLHSHAMGEHIPSPGDMGYFINEKARDYRKGVVVVGYGVISKKGIRIVKLPEKKGRLDELGDGFIAGRTLKERYDESAKYRMKEKLGVKTEAEIKQKLAEMPDAERIRFMHRAFSGAFRQVRAEEPDIRTRTARKTHHQNVRVRR